MVKVERGRKRGERKGKREEDSVGMCEGGEKVEGKRVRKRGCGKNTVNIKLREEDNRKRERKKQREQRMRE